MFFELEFKGTRVASTENSYTISGLQKGFFFAVRVHAWHGKDAGPWFHGQWCDMSKDGTVRPFASFVSASKDTPTSESVAEVSILITAFTIREEHFPMTINYRLSETGDMLHSTREHSAAITKIFPYRNYIKVSLVDDVVDEADSTVTVTILPGSAYNVGTLSSFTFTVSDDD